MQMDGGEMRMGAFFAYRGDGVLQRSPCQMGNELIGRKGLVA